MSAAVRDSPPAARAAHGVGLGVALLVAGAACAQTFTSLEPDAGVRGDAALRACLTTGAGLAPAPPPYPPDELALKHSATVRIRMRFVAPDAPPDVTVFFKDGGAAFETTVRQHVQSYRLPCLSAPGAVPVTFTQEFYFDPRDGRPVVWNAVHQEKPQAPDNPCTHRNDAAIEYPTDALRQDATSSRIEKKTESGVVLATIDVDAEGKPPRITVLHDAGSRRLADAVTEYMQHTQLRCARYPVKGLQQFTFNVDDGPRYGLNDMPLVNFLTIVKDIDKQKVRFDFSTMGCPFQLQMRLLQPYLPNQVGEVAAADPNRADFIEWVTTLTPQFKPAAAKHLVGAETRINVPCGTLDLTS